MMEILPESVKAEREAKARRKSATSNTSEILLDDLARIKKGLLLKSNKNNVSRFTVSSRLTEDQVKTISSMLPDEVINNAYDYEPRKLYAVVLFADVSGFTDLSDKYQSLESGASKLSMVLNSYIGSMVQEILSQGGDIIKYAGDAFLAIFRAENELKMQDEIHKAINSSLIIQKNCSNYSTDFESVTLNGEINITSYIDGFKTFVHYAIDNIINVITVKIAISCGKVFFSLIGNDISSHYVTVGEPVWDVKFLQDIIKPGQTLVSQKAWFFVQEFLYCYNYKGNSRYYQIYDFKDSLQVAQRQYEAVVHFQEMQQKFDIKDKTDQSSASATQEASFDPQNVTISSGEGDFTLRKSKLTMDEKSRKFLRRFIIPPVLNAIDLNEPIDLLTEMRHVVIVFANFVVSKTSDEELVNIVDRIYTKLNSLVTEHEGTLNKVSLFDKDLMFLIIFGLRGFKHELESRVALRCASELHETFKSWPKVLTVSLGVTTGMSYCGVVGHTLRREYSVISVTVNKAARLMVAYPNIVSCDQETLLYSKFELRHFKILPKKKMKGLRHEIIVYEFNEVIDDIEVLQPFKYEFPILGQKDVIELSLKLLKAAIINFNQEANDLEQIFHKISCLVIKDEKQQGMTRVLEEIYSNFYQKNLQCIRLSLNIKYLKIPYFVISKIMKRVLNIENGNSSCETTAQKLIAKMFNGFNVDEFLCLLNPIFDVNFKTSETVICLEEEDAMQVRKIMFSILCTQTFQTFFTLLIDDIELMDEQSFSLLEYFFKSNTVFTVITLGNQRNLNECQKRILNIPTVTHYRLGPIDVIYQTELACRFLKVSALSLEFEEYLHKYSEGNPGWIKNTSETLLQSNKIVIKSVAFKDVLEKGIVISKSVSEWQQSEDSSSFLKQHYMFNQCYKSENDFENEDFGEKLIKVAMLTSEGNFDERRHSLMKESLKITRADSDLMTYDSLSSYEQLVCKCAAVIGVEFTRHMLSYIISNSTDRMIGKAMVKLFEIQVFKCTSTPEEAFKESDLVVCNCQNVRIFDSCRDLPRYSCCAGIRFQRNGFRSVVYDSLTEKQRIEYHRRSLLYLHMQTRRCDSCGNKPFDELLLYEFDFQFHDGVFHEDDNSYQSMVEYFESINLPVKRNIQRSLWSKLFPMLNRKQKPELRPVILNFKSYDFLNCKCNLILYSMYSEMIRHCHGADTVCKLIESKIELASMSIKISNIPRANSLLCKALWQLDNKVFDDESRYYEYLRGRALTLQGVCFTRMMQKQSALELCHEACCCFNVFFPKTFNLKARMKLQSLIINIRKSYKTKEITKCSKLFSLVTHQLSETLSLMFALLFKKKHYNLAKLAAFWSLRKALKFNRRFSNVTRSFANVLKIIFFTGTVDDFLWLQDAALELTNRAIFSESLNLDSLKNVVRMYNGIMMCQIARKQIRVAIKIGEMSKELCSKIQQTRLPTKIVPIMFLLLMNMKRIQDAQRLLEQFGTAVRMTSDKNGQIWYYALCMDLLLDTSQTIESYEECDEFHMSEIITFNKDGHCEARARFYANLLLWSVRHKVREITQIWMKYLSDCFFLDRHSSINNTFTSLRVIEALTIQLGFAVENRNLDLFLHLNKQLIDIMKILDSAFTVTKCFTERFELLKLHFALVKGFKAKRLKTLDGLLELSLKNKNFYSFDLIQHMKRAWSREMPTDQRTFWIDHSTKDKSLNIKKVFYLDRVFPYSLPIPMSGNF